MSITQGSRNLYPDTVVFKLPLPCRWHLRPSIYWRKKQSLSGCTFNCVRGKPDDCDIGFKMMTYATDGAHLRHVSLSMLIHPPFTYMSDHVHLPACDIYFWPRPPTHMWPLPSTHLQRIRLTTPTHSPVGVRTVANTDNWGHVSKVDNCGH